MTPETISDLDQWKPQKVIRKQTSPSKSESAHQRWEEVRAIRLYYEGLSELLKTENFFPTQYAKLEQELWAVAAWMRKHDTKH